MDMQKQCGVWCAVTSDQSLMAFGCIVSMIIVLSMTCEGVLPRTGVIDIVIDVDGGGGCFLC